MAATSLKKLRQGQQKAGKGSDTQQKKTAAGTCYNYVDYQVNWQQDSSVTEYKKNTFHERQSHD